MHVGGLLAALVLAFAGGGSAAVVSVSLTVDVLNFNTSDTPISFTTRAYNGKFGGPVIRVKQGDTLEISLANKLTKDLDGPNNWFRLANTTNLHLHGLHISQVGSSDDVFRRVLPNTTGLYSYEIPADHSPGTFWYHPHVHGSSSNQQGGGMAGVLIVEPADPATLPPALAAMEEEVLLLQHLCFHNSGKYQSSTPVSPRAVCLCARPFFFPFFIFSFSLYLILSSTVQTFFLLYDHPSTVHQPS